MMIRVASVDGAGAVECFEQYDHGEVVWERQGRYAPLCIAGGDDFIWQAVRAANDEADFSAFHAAFVQKIG